MKKRLALLGLGFLQIIILGFVVSCPGSYEFQEDGSFDRRSETAQSNGFSAEGNEIANQTAEAEMETPILLTFPEAEAVCQRFSLYTEFDLGKNSPLRFALHGASEIPYCVWLNRVQGDAMLLGSSGVFRHHDDDVMSVCVEAGEEDPIRLIVITSEEHARVALRLQRGWTE